MSADPRATGERVLASLDRGRLLAVAQHQARSAELVRAVRRELDVDVLEGGAGRGRAGRIARRLRRYGHRVSDRWVRKILERLSSGSDSVGSTPTIAPEDRVP